MLSDQQIDQRSEQICGEKSRCFGGSVHPFEFQSYHGSNSAGRSIDNHYINSPFLADFCRFPNPQTTTTSSIPMAAYTYKPELLAPFLALPQGDKIQAECMHHIAPPPCHPQPDPPNRRLDRWRRRAPLQDHRRSSQSIVRLFSLTRQ
jgi:hypothetical protein